MISEYRLGPDSKSGGGKGRGEVLGGMESGHQAVFPAVSLPSGHALLRTTPQPHYFWEGTSQPLTDTTAIDDVLACHSIVHVHRFFLITNDCVMLLIIFYNIISD